MLKVATVLPHEQYREYKDVERVYSGSTEIDKILDKNGNVLFAVNKEVEGTPALAYKGKEETNLKNYRIYGQTVDGESVGDRTGNLFDGFSVHGMVPSVSTGELTNSPSGGATTDFIAIDNGDITLSKSNAAQSNMYIFLYAQDKSYIGYSQTTAADTLILYGNSINGYQNAKYARIRVDVESAHTQANIMLSTGSEPLPYEPYGYRVPVTVTNGTDTQTTNLYLPEPIKMVGDEAEYIDYAEQKQHRVRKNLLPNNGTSYTASVITATKNDDGSVTISNHGEKGAQVTWVYYNSDDVLFKAGTQIIISTRYTASISFKYSDNAWSGSISQNQVYTIPKDIIMAYSQFYINADEICTLYPMIRKADIEDDTYEPYIKNVDLDVTLPALPVLPGANVLTVGTEVQPSNVYLKGRIKEVS